MALVALYRPGPMENIPTYCEVKNGLRETRLGAPADRPYPRRDPGHHRLPGTGDADRPGDGGLPLGGADLLRRAMGKKIQEAMDAERPKFVDGAAENGVDKAQGHRGLRPAGEVRQLRLQQVPRRRLCGGQLPDRLAQGEPPGRIHGRGDELRHPPHRQARRLCRGGAPRPRHRDRAALREPLRRRPSRCRTARSSTRWARSRTSASRR